MTTPLPNKNDLGVRTISAVVMLAVAGTALWLGGWWWTAFVLAVGYGVIFEWHGLAKRIAGGVLGRILWMIGATAYVGTAIFLLYWLRNEPHLGAWFLVAIPVSAVIATDIGAYFAGRTFGGPKIASKISPSKTWSGLVGGMTASALTLMAWTQFDPAYSDHQLPFHFILALGAAIAIVAQAGDFFESWMKRRAGMKDSGSLIPGHGGLFDRVDGLLAVLFAVGLISCLYHRLIAIGIAGGFSLWWGPA